MKRSSFGICCNGFKKLLQNRCPGQLVIQLTDRCNARCPQCGMRVTAPFERNSLSTDDVKRMIDAAASHGFQAVSFTGGEPMLHFGQLVELICHAGAAGIPFIRTGTNGFMFQGHEKKGFLDRVRRMAETLSRTPIRNFWISIDSAEPSVHERMRGFGGVIAGIEKALPVFHAAGIYPSANIGINRNMGGDGSRRLLPPAGTRAPHEIEVLHELFLKMFHRMYRLVSELGFTIVNTCYPMQIDDRREAEGLSAVYGATSVDDIVRFSRQEKAALYQALLEVIPNYRSKIRIFTPLCALTALADAHRSNRVSAYPCRGGIDYFFIDSKNGDTYPCGYRGNENMGPFHLMNPDALESSQACTLCDWECFRDPSELVGPLLKLRSGVGALATDINTSPRFYGLWIKDLLYYQACGFFDGRKPPRRRLMTAVGKLFS